MDVRFKGALAALGGFFGARAVLSRARAFPLRGKVALVTGGSRGLGLAIARELGRFGAKVAVCARDLEELERAREDLARRGVHAIAVRCDVADRSSIDAAAAEVLRRLGPVDVLVNNAGVMQFGPLGEMTGEDFEKAMDVHFWGPLHFTRAVLPGMRARRSGRIVNVSSIGGKIGIPHALPYSASKFALTGVSEGLRAELARDGVVVTTACPGLLRTGSPRQAEFKGRNRAEYALFVLLDSIPGITMSAKRAARQIVRACRLGKGEVVIGFAAKASVIALALLPSLVLDLAALAGRFLPAPGGIGKAIAKGAESESRLTRSRLTFLTRRAEALYNQLH